MAQASDFTTKIGTFWSHFLDHMKQLKGATGEGSSLPIRVVADGEFVQDALPRPYLAVQLLSTKVSHRVDRNKQWEGKIKIRIVSDIVGDDAGTFEALAKIGVVENAIETYQLPDGVTGLENAEWSIARDTSARGGVVMADSVRDVAVVVARGAN